MGFLYMACVAAVRPSELLASTENVSTYFCPKILIKIQIDLPITNIDFHWWLKISHHRRHRHILHKRILAKHFTCWQLSLIFLIYDGHLARVDLAIIYDYKKDSISFQLFPVLVTGGDSEVCT